MKVGQHAANGRVLGALAATGRPGATCATGATVVGQVATAARSHGGDPAMDATLERAFREPRVASADPSPAVPAGQIRVRLALAAM